jgi:hypothetical protein
VVGNGDSVVSAAASAFKEKWQVDPDVVPTTTYVLTNCAYVETPSCTGTLPNHANPYVKGLVGNFKAYRNYVYYGTRMETDPTVDTRIRHNGYISGFGSYWSFNTYNNLVPNTSNANWLWNTEITKMNSKGQELETHDALNRYTMAQYGFAKNFPVAVARNAAYGQAFYAGFEDNSYSESINHSVLDTCPNTKYVNFTGANILLTDNTTIKAHTGRYVLEVTSVPSPATIPVPVGLSDSVNYTMAFGSTTTGPLNSPGINFSSSSAPAGYTPTFSHSYSTTGVSIGAYMPTSTGHNVTTNWDGYIQIINSQPYNFAMGVGSNYNYYNSVSTSISATIYDSHNNIYSNLNCSNAAGSQVGTLTYQVTLCPGIYHIVGSTAETYVSTTADYSNSNWSWQCTNCNSNMYSSTSITNNCTTTTPIPSNQAMLNTVFSLQPGQKMQFSGWVSQDCGTPCYLTSYTHPHVTLQFPGADTPSIALHPSGTIIEGWQRVDTSFYVPINATTASLVLGTDSAINVYFDDLRIQPFNADMKTYVYDPQTLRLMAELDENNYATFYNYDEEGQLVRVKKETIQGIKTIKETRTAKQKTITNVQ